MSQAKKIMKKTTTKTLTAIAGPAPSGASGDPGPSVGSVVVVVVVSVGEVLVATVDVTITHLVRSYPFEQKAVTVRLSSATAETLKMSNTPQLTD